jgi:hypothetical protein
MRENSSAVSAEFDTLPSMLLCPELALDTIQFAFGGCPFNRHALNAEGWIRTRGTGLFPCDGSLNRCSENASLEKTNTCERLQTPLPHERPRQG